MNKQELVEMIVVTGELMARELSPDAVMMMVEDLSDYQPQLIAEALKRLRREGGRFTTAEILKRLPGTWPGSDEAWAMCPKGEAETACMCPEMHEALAIASDCGSDRVAARMAFKSAYDRLVSEAQMRGESPSWSMSLGHDKATHQPSMERAVIRGYLSAERAGQIMPEVGVDWFLCIAEGKPSRLMTRSPGPPAEVLYLAERLRAKA